MKKRISQVAGLQTAPNLLDAPQGSFKRLDNCIVRTKNLIESRRGQDTLSYGLGNASPRDRITDTNTVRRFACDEPLANAALVDAVGGPSIPLVGANIPSGSGQILGSRAWPTANACFHNFGSPYANDYTALHSAGAFSVAWWVKPRSSDWDHMMSGDPLDDYARVICTLGYGVGTGSYFSGLLLHLEVKRATSDGRNARTVRALYEKGVAGSGVVESADSTVSLAFDVWTRVFYTFNGSSGVGIFYFNGVAVTTVTGLAAPSGGTTSATLAIGCHPQLNVHFFKGQLDGGFIGNRVYTPAEVLADYNRGVGIITPATINELTHFGGSVLAHVADDVLVRDTGSLFAAYEGSYAPPAPDELRMKFARSQERLYLTTDAGVKRLEALTGFVPVAAGIPAPQIDANQAHVIADARGFLAENSAVAYRTTLAHRDTNRRELESAPGSRLVVRSLTDLSSAAGAVVLVSNVVTVTFDTTHALKPGESVALNAALVGFPFPLILTVATVPTSFKITAALVAANANSAAVSTWDVGGSVAIATRRVDLRLLVPSEAAVGDILRLWRTETTAAATTEPGDECLLCYEKQLGASDITTGYVAFSDYTPDAYLGAPAYFAPSQETLAKQNSRPPLSRDIATFDGCLWFANVQQRQQVEVTVLATGGSQGIATGDTLSIVMGSHSITLTAAISATFDDGDGHYLLYQGGDILDNEKTALSLISSINAHVSNDFVDAFYLSDPSNDPGAILLQERGVGSASPFQLYVSAHGLGFRPQLPTSGAYSSKSSVYPHRVYKSKKEQPEAVPVLSGFVVVGEADDPIERIVECGGALWVFKARSTWTVSPAGGDAYSVVNFSPDLHLVGNDTPAVMGRSIFCLSSVGPISLSSAGVTQLGLPIDYDISALFGYDAGFDPILPTLKRYGFGVAYASDRQYLLALPSVPQDTGGYADTFYVWNIGTSVWTVWPLTRTCGVVEPTTDLLYLGGLEADATLWKERKQFRKLDYKDQSSALTISSVSADADGNPTLTVTDASRLAVGGLIALTGGALSKGIIKSVVGSVATVWSATGVVWSSGAATAYRPIPIYIQWLDESCDVPGALKLLQGANLHFQEGGFYTAALSLGTELAASSAMKDLVGPEDYDVSNYTGVGGPRDDFSTPPTEQARAGYYSFVLALTECESRLKLAGLSLDFTVATERTGKR